MIQLIFEGPKGSGKSTLTERYSKKYEAKVEHFSGDRHLLTQQFLQDATSRKNVIYDRGWLSYLIYGYIWNATQQFNAEIDGPKLTLHSWAPLGDSQFQSLIDATQQKYVILYSSNYQLLVDRLNARSENAGKHYTKKELQDLKKSNTMFKHYGKMMQELYGDKIIAIDIAKTQDFKELDQLILGENHEQ